MSDAEREAFADHCEGDTLEVELHVVWQQVDGGAPGRATGRYFGRVYRHGPFQSVRSAGAAQQKLSAFRELVDADAARYPFNRRETAWGRADAALVEWERQHRDECESVLDEGGFFRAPNAADSPLAPYTQLVFVPAIRDASDEAADSASATLGRLTRLIVGDITDSADVQEMQEEFRSQFATIVKKHGEARLPALQTRIAEALHGYAPHTEVELQWVEGDVRLQAPKTRIWIEDDGFSGDIEGKGHGLQRLFVLSMLQVAADVGPAGGVGDPDLLLIIEEPELFQHPMQARRFRRVLANLTESNASSRRNQVAFSTHSPLFIDFSRFDGIRRVEKVAKQPGEPAVSCLTSVTLQSVMQKIEEAFEREDYTVEHFRTTLGAIFDSDVSEGFFSRATVLVEGLEDQAILATALQNSGFDPEQNGLAIVACGGKTNLDRPYAIFSGLGIPVYLIFDGDRGCREDEKGNHIRHNLALQRLSGAIHVEEFPNTVVTDSLAVFADNFQEQVSREVGLEIYEGVVAEVAREMGWVSTSRAKKNAMVLREVLVRVNERGKNSESLDEVVKMVKALV